MKYCTRCGGEYEDSVTACADDGNAELVPLEEMHRRGLVSSEERDTRKFVRAGTAEDPLSAERFSDLLEEAQIPVFARARRAGTVDNITGGLLTPWWELLVPEEHLAKATSIIEEARREIEEQADEAGRAAEDEAEKGPA